MQNPISYYLDLVDGAAFDQAETGAPIGRYDAPVMPFFAPWIIGGPLLALTPTNSAASIIIAAITFVASGLCWAIVWRFYLNRVYAYRKQMGTEREPPDRRLTAAILIATALGLIYAFWDVFSHRS